MAVLRFTGAGVVAAPTTLHVRVTRALPGRLPAGAPEPPRSLTDAEVRATLHRFTVERAGPRSRPCTALVLSGTRLADRPGLARIVAEGRGWGLERVVLHLGTGERSALRASPLRDHVDEIVIVVRGTGDLADVGALGRDGLAVSAVLPLDAPTLPRLDTLAGALAALAPARVLATWPLQAPAPPPHAARVVHALQRPVQVLQDAGVEVGIKGLPLCALGPLHRLAWRTGNRVYVDAAHQGEAALLFFPDVVRLSKDDDCRFCALDGRCDGAPAAWRRDGRVGPLRPVEAPT